MIYLVGDIHGKIDIAKLNPKNFPQGNTLTKKDYVIVLGDFGLLWSNNDKERYWLKWLDSRPWTTLFLDGNHENFDMINKLPLIAKFGGIVGKVSDSIYHLRRGEIYIINGKKFFVFGGANSIDKKMRTIGISWWPEEIPSYAEMNKGLDNLEKHGFCVDYVLTHTCPNKIVGLIDKMYEDETDPTRIFLDDVDKRTTFKKWFFGHWHDDLEFFDEKYIMLYDVIRGLG